ncbi:MAG: radical SAM protein [Actinomycetota bacterium]|jgi:radical SAM protein with 4Fe4S-binding SPASM domain|nr:radical SAM protein [Actinomycetota bacterium]
MAHIRSLFFDGPLAEVENKAITAYKLGRPSEIIWNITNRCNLLCDHCYMSADAHQRPEQLSDEDSIALVKQMAEIGVPLLFMSGGEPMMRSNFWEILNEARSYDMHVVVSTNATMIDRAIAKRLKTAGVDWIATSLYGPADFHDALVGVPGTRDRVVNTIKILREEGVRVALKSAVSSDTWPHVKELIATAKELDCGLIYLCDLITSGRSEGEEDGRITAEQWRELADYVLADVLDPETTLEYDIGALPSVIPYMAEKLIAQGIDVTKGLERLKTVSACPVGKGHMNINSEGGIMPCQFAQDWTIGNVRDMTLAEAARKLFEYDEQNAQGVCSDEECEYSRICRGCRTKAFHEFGDPMGPDTTCILHPNDKRSAAGAAKSGSQTPSAPCAMGSCS